MKLVKCKKCGSVIMTSETLLSNMQDEYNNLIKKSQKAKPAERQIIVQQLSQLKKMMVAVCHSSSESELRKNAAYNEVILLKKYIIENNIMDQNTLDQIQGEAREAAKRKAESPQRKEKSLRERK